MNDEEIKRFLTLCVYQEMNSFQPSQEEDYNHEFSKKFRKRWKKMNWSEKYFGSHLHLAYAVRKVAAVLVMILSLAAANQVSAKVFGFNAWKYLLSYDEKSKMEVREYVGQNHDEKQGRNFRLFFIRNQHMFRADFGIRRMMVPLQEILIIMIGKREKKILFSIFAANIGRMTLFIRIRNINGRLKQVLWDMRHIIM